MGQDMLCFALDVSEAHCFTDPLPAVCCHSFQVQFSTWNWTPLKLLHVGLFLNLHSSQSMVLIPVPCIPNYLYHQLWWTDQGLIRVRYTQGYPFRMCCICCPVVLYFNLVCQIKNIGWRNRGNMWRITWCDVPQAYISVISHMQGAPAGLTPVMDLRASVMWRGCRSLLVSLSTHEMCDSSDPQFPP